MSEEQQGQLVNPEPTKGRSMKTVKAAPPGPALRSYWPLALALALMVMLVGLLIHPIVLGIGAVLAAAAIIGWGLERR